MYNIQQAVYTKNDSRFMDMDIMSLLFLNIYYSLYYN